MESVINHEKEDWDRMLNSAGEDGFVIIMESVREAQKLARKRFKAMVKFMGGPVSVQSKFASNLEEMMAEVMRYIPWILEKLYSEGSYMTLSEFAGAVSTYAEIRWYEGLRLYAELARISRELSVIKIASMDLNAMEEDWKEHIHKLIEQSNDWYDEINERKEFNHEYISWPTKERMKVMEKVKNEYEKIINEIQIVEESGKLNVAANKRRKQRIEEIMLEFEVDRLRDTRGDDISEDLMSFESEIVEEEKVKSEMTDALKIEDDNIEIKMTSYEVMETRIIEYLNAKIEMNMENKFITGEIVIEENVENEIVRMDNVENDIVRVDNVENEIVSNDRDENENKDSDSTADKITEHEVLVNRIIENRTVDNEIVENKFITEEIVEEENVKYEIVGTDNIENEIVRMDNVENEIVRMGNVENEVVRKDSVENKAWIVENISNEFVDNEIIENKSIRNEDIENDNIVRKLIENKARTRTGEYEISQKQDIRIDKDKLEEHKVIGNGNIILNINDIMENKFAEEEMIKEKNKRAIEDNVESNIVNEGRLANELLEENNIEKEVLEEEYMRNKIVNDETTEDQDSRKEYLEDKFIDEENDEYEKMFELKMSKNLQIEKMKHTRAEGAEINSLEDRGLQRYEQGNEVSVIRSKIMLVMNEVSMSKDGKGNVERIGLPWYIRRKRVRLRG